MSGPVQPEFWDKSERGVTPQVSIVARAPSSSIEGVSDLTNMPRQLVRVAESGNLTEIVKLSSSLGRLMADSLTGKGDGLRRLQASTKALPFRGAGVAQPPAVAAALRKGAGAPYIFRNSYVPIASGYRAFCFVESDPDAELAARIVRDAHPTYMEIDSVQALFDLVSSCMTGPEKPLVVIPLRPGNSIVSCLAANNLVWCRGDSRAFDFLGDGVAREAVLVTLSSTEVGVIVPDGADSGMVFSGIHGRLNLPMPSIVSAGAYATPLDQSRSRTSMTPPYAFYNAIASPRLLTRPRWGVAADVRLSALTPETIPTVSRRFVAEIRAGRPMYGLIADFGQSAGTSVADHHSFISDVAWNATCYTLYALLGLQIRGGSFGLAPTIYKTRSGCASGCGMDAPCWVSPRTAPVLETMGGIYGMTPINPKPVVLPTKGSGWAVPDLMSDSFFEGPLRKALEARTYLAGLDAYGVSDRLADQLVWSLLISPFTASSRGIGFPHSTGAVAFPRSVPLRTRRYAPTSSVAAFMASDLAAAGYDGLSTVSLSDLPALMKATGGATAGVTLGVGTTVKTANQKINAIMAAIMSGAVVFKTKTGVAVRLDFKVSRNIYIVVTMIDGHFSVRLQSHASRVHDVARVLLGCISWNSWTSYDLSAYDTTQLTVGVERTAAHRYALNDPSVLGLGDRVAYIQFEVMGRLMDWGRHVLSGQGLASGTSFTSALNGCVTEALMFLGQTMDGGAFHYGPTSVIGVTLPQMASDDEIPALPRSAQARGTEAGDDQLIVCDGIDPDHVSSILQAQSQVAGLDGAADKGGIFLRYLAIRGDTTADSTYPAMVFSSDRWMAALERPRSATDMFICPLPLLGYRAVCYLIAMALPAVDKVEGDGASRVRVGRLESVEPLACFEGLSPLDVVVLFPVFKPIVDSVMDVVAQRQRANERTMSIHRHAVLVGPTGVAQEVGDASRLYSKFVASSVGAPDALSSVIVDPDAVVQSSLATGGYTPTLDPAVGASEGDKEWVVSMLSLLVPRYVPEIPAMSRPCQRPATMGTSVIPVSYHPLPTLVPSATSEMLRSMSAFVAELVAPPEFRVRSAPQILTSLLVRRDHASELGAVIRETRVNGVKVVDISMPASLPTQLSVRPGTYYDIPGVPLPFDMALHPVLAIGRQSWIHQDFVPDCTDPISVKAAQVATHLLVGTRTWAVAEATPALLGAILARLTAGATIFRVGTDNPVSVPSLPTAIRFPVRVADDARTFTPDSSMVDSVGRVVAISSRPYGPGALARTDRGTAIVLDVTIQFLEGVRTYFHVTDLVSSASVVPSAKPTRGELK